MSSLERLSYFSAVSPLPKTNITKTCDSSLPLIPSLSHLLFIIIHRHRVRDRACAYFPAGKRHAAAVAIPPLLHCLLLLPYRWRTKRRVVNAARTSARHSLPAPRYCCAARACVYAGISVPVAALLLLSIALQHLPQQTPSRAAGCGS